MAKRTWLDGQVGNTPITAARLNDLEEDVATALVEANSALAAAFAAGASNIGVDLDGVPYYDIGAASTTIEADTDGVPYFI